MKTALAAIAAATLTFAAPMSQATVITSAYTPMGGNSWLADFTVFNDGNPTTFAGFTIDFPNASNLALVGSPATWDSAVFQPDPTIPDPGFLDSFAISSSSYLTTGQSLGGFRVSFTYAGGTPGGLPFVINSATFAPLFTGITTVSAIPEPTSAFLVALGLAAVALRTARTSSQNRATGNHKGVTA